MSRPVILADVRRTTVALRPVHNGSGLGPSDVHALAVSAALDPVRTKGATLLPLRQLADLEAYCSTKSIAVQRIGRVS